MAESPEAAASATTWVEVEPCYVFHPLNAFDADDGTVVVDVVRHPSMFRTVHDGPDEGTPVLERRRWSNRGTWRHPSAVAVVTHGEV